MPAAETDFSPAEVDRARRYHRPLYLAFAAETALGLAVAAAYAFAGPGDRVASSVASLPWWVVVVLLTEAVVVTSFVVRLPIVLWRGYVRERRYGFSTQTWGDRSKALAVQLALTVLPVVALVGLARALPAAWPVAVAPGAALLVILPGLVAPVVLEPIFNRFRPLPDEELARHAYGSGIGRTRRVVLYDTLLARAAPRELLLITAHELSHRRCRDVAKGTDLDPPSLAYACLFSHPTPPERIASARAWKAR